ncbi:MAG: site-2 protease family protein [Pseudonocardiales bacterium]|nr:site-2 protease family protein [Pseudonocardiales bacterium]MBV9728314.1 site-2 protease family protein [Pseudonocardiales bacterium]
MTFVLGVVLFAVGIGVSIALHEAGHMYSAKAFGMKVRRYFIGFGPTLFSVRRGETEYGLKMIPAGGFCDIAGMTALDELPDPDDRKRAFFRFPTWQRVVVLSAGSLTHFAVGIVLIYVMAVSTGLPNLNPKPPAAVVSAVSQCIRIPDGSCQAPARDAGLRPADRILAVADKPVSNFDELARAIKSRSGPTKLLIKRTGQRPFTVWIDVTQVRSSELGGQGNQLVGAIGVSPPRPGPVTLRFGPVDAVGKTVTFAGTMFVNTAQALQQFPHRIPSLLDRIAGENRPDSPVSVVGASVLGGDAADFGAWWFFLFLLAALNLFVGIFNLLPLLPLDGGHIAVNVYEGVRNAVRRATGRPNGPPVDYTRLMPLTYAVAIVFIGVSMLTITADIIHPIRLRP